MYWEIFRKRELIDIVFQELFGTIWELLAIVRESQALHWDIGVIIRMFSFFPEVIFPRATSQTCNFPSRNLLSMSQPQRSVPSCSSRGARSPITSQLQRSAPHCSLRHIREPNPTLGKLLLGKMHIWDVATWEIVTWKVALGKMPLGKYLN